MRAGPQCAQLPQGRTDEIASLLAQMDAPFTAPEAVELAKRTPALKAAIGPLPPWLLKPAITAMAPLWAAEANAWRRVARLSRPDARSSITMLAKPGGAPVTPADFRGIAVSPVFPKLYAAGLARRVSAHAEAAGTHADGQFGFRPGRSTEQAALALRTLMDRYRLLRKPGSRQRGTKLWACFVDFKQAYDRVPREALWAKLALMGYSGEWLRAVQAIYAEVPMSVNVPGIAHRLIHTTIGLKQGCPLSPILFDLYIADFERRMLDAAAAGGFHLPELLPGYPAPPLFFADDCALLATTAAGLQAQLRELEAYCRENGLTVNVKKTKVMLLAGATSEEAALRRVRKARFTYAGSEIEAVPDFKYLGITFHCCKPLGESAAATRAAVARFAAASFEARCEELGLEAAKLLLTLYDVLVDSTLSYAGAVWAPGLAMAAAARPVVSGGAGRSTPLSEPELQHLRFLRRLLALPRSTPAATILAEAGQPPLHARWLQQAARLWNSLVTAPEGSMPRLVVQAAAAVAVDCADVPPQRQPWAAQLAHSLRAVGLTFEPLHMDKISPDGTQQATLRLHLARVTQETPAHTRLRHYFCDVRPECCSLDGYGRPPYVTEVRERRCRRGLTELRTGMHWGAEEQGRRTGTPREQRVCPHCPALDGPGGIEDTRHILFVCPLYAAERERWPELFHEFLGLPPASVPLSAFFQQSNTELAALAAACRKKARDAVSPQ